MPALSSFIKPPKPPKWKSIIPGRSPFPAGRLDSISSPHPYAAQDILDIHESTTSFGSVVPSPLVKPSIQNSPQFTLDLDVKLPTGDFDSDWIDNQFANSPLLKPQAVGRRGERSRGDIYESRTVAPTPAPRWEPRGVPAEVPIDDDDDDIDLSTSEDDVLKSLEAMDASTFLHLPPQQNQTMDSVMASPAKRNPPAPIRIPSLSMHGPQVQVVRSAGHISRPLSEVSTAESSAVSGQTLARALLGNSFVLSSDNRSSRYRSGFGGLVRSDSATLPRGDHPFMNSPFLRDRTLSGTSDTFAVDHGVPPIPPNAEKVYVPPQTPRHSGADAKRKALRRHSSTGSLSSPGSRGEFGESKSRPNSVGEFTRELEKVERDLQMMRRISRISEAPSVSTTAANHDDPSYTPSSGQSPITVSPGQAEALPPHSPSNIPSEPSTAPSNYQSPVVSVTPPASSTKESSDNILDYYSAFDTPEPEPGRGFAPVVSPIIEETSSQLSSPGSRRLSQRPTSRTLSPLSGTINGRIDLNVVRRPSDGTVISPNPRRSSVHMAPGNQGSPKLPSQTSPSTDDKNTTGQRASLIPPPPISRLMGGRLRSGSAPSPIKITRDSRDLNTYNIISPLPENVAETPSTGGSSGMEVQQTFPETPNAFSPFWSPGTSSPGMTQGLPEGYDVSPMPLTPKSATALTHGGIPLRSLEQQILTRSATMAQAGHSKQRDVVERGPSGHQLPTTTLVSSGAANLGDDGAEVGMIQEVDAPPLDRMDTSLASTPSQYSEASGGTRSPRQQIGHSFTTVGATIEARPSSPSSSLNSSPRLGYLAQPSPTVAPLPSEYLSPSHHGTDFTDPFDPYAAYSRSNYQDLNISPFDHSLQSPPPVVVTPPAGDPTPTMTPYLNRSLRRISEISQNLESPPAYEDIHHDQPPSITPTSGNSTNIDLHFNTASAQPSPPATMDSSNEHLPLGRRLSNGNRDRRGRMRPTGPRRPLSHLPHGQPPTRVRNPSISSVASTGRNNTSTPPPKSASATPTIEPKVFPTNSPNPNGQPEHNPALSNNANNTPPTTTSTPSDPSPASPYFQVPPMPYRGMTMDQAKWTFTSAQLQTIVSRAIRQTAEASSIRLLRLETLDNDIPQELTRLESRKSEIKSKYKSLTRASGSLFLKLDEQIANGDANLQRTLEELRDTTRQLNRLTEELHAVDNQHAQIQNLVQVHSASALRMALRKLNTSFLKQLSQTQVLERQVAELEDEIWTLNELRSMKTSPENQALTRTQSFSQTEIQPPSAAVTQDSPSQVAFPNSHSNEPVGGWGSEFSGKKSAAHSMVITRKPSLSYSMSIRSSGNRLSQRSSLSSNGARTSTVFAGSVGGPSSASGVPPVPPLPRRRPTDIITDAPTRSTTMLSTDGGTPGTEVRAMIRAQDELYQMLGIPIRDDLRLRRSHSIIGLPGNPEAQPHPSSTASNFLQPSAALSRSESLDSTPFSNRGSKVHGRPQSYPASLLEAYNPLDADRTAMLATLEMISQDGH